MRVVCEHACVSVPGAPQELGVLCRATVPKRGPSCPSSHPLWDPHLAHSSSQLPKEGVDYGRVKFS